MSSSRRYERLKDVDADGIATLWYAQICCSFFLLIGVAVVVVLELLTSSTFRGYLVNYGCSAPFVINSNVLLSIGTGFLILSYWVSIVWPRDGKWGGEFAREVNVRHRPIRWIAHAFYMTFYIAALGLLLPIPDYVSLFTLAAVGGVGLAFFQSYNEAVSNRSKEGEKVPLTAFNEGEGRQFEGYFVALAIVAGLVVAFILYGTNIVPALTVAPASPAVETATIWIPAVAAGLYVVLHIGILVFTNYGVWTNFGHEAFIFGFEIVFALFLHLAIYIALVNTSVTVPTIGACPPPVVV